MLKISAGSYPKFQATPDLKKRCIPESCQMDTRRCAVPTGLLLLLYGGVAFMYDSPRSLASSGRVSPSSHKLNNTYEVPSPKALSDSSVSAAAVGQQVSDAHALSPLMVLLKYLLSSTAQPSPPPAIQWCNLFNNNFRLTVIFLSVSWIILRLFALLLFF